MTWSYSGNPGSSTRDEVRFLIGDTDTDDQLLSNEELDYLITTWTDPYAAAVAAVTGLISQAARAVEETKSVGDLSLTKKAGARLAQWQSLMAELNRQRLYLGAFAPKGGLEGEMQFAIGQMDNN